MVQQVAWFGGGGVHRRELAPLLARGAAGGRRGGAGGGRRGAHRPAGGRPRTVAAAIGSSCSATCSTRAVRGRGAMVNTEQEAQQAAFPVMLPLIVSAVFIQPVLANPDSALSRFAAWFPFSAPIIMPMRMSLVSTSAAEVAAVLAGLAVALAGTTWLAARIYRVGLLMYGKRPSVRELARWLREAA
jgi:ABC-2 type transport system permease protein